MRSLRSTPASCQIALVFVTGVFVGILFLNSMAQDIRHLVETNVSTSRHNTVDNDYGVAARMGKRVEDTRYMCAEGYPGPGGKDDCAMARKLLADPQYIINKM